MTIGPSDGFLDVVERAVEGHRRMVSELVDQSGQLLLIADVIAESLHSKRKVLTFGNGGSAADAQHMVAELVGRFTRERRALAAIALTTDTSVLTAIANDYSYEQVFARQLEALAEPGDVAVAISTSGSSPNVLAATRKAKEMGLKTVGLTGQAGGTLAALADHCLCVGNGTARAQEGHITAIHIICEIVECRISPR